MANTKLDRIERDIEKTRAKILEQQKKLKDLEAQKVEEENAQIVAFLKTLTGDQPQITLPILPVSSDKTPRPDPFAPIVAPMKK